MGDREEPTRVGVRWGAARDDECGGEEGLRDGEEGAAREEGTISEGRRGRGNDVPAKSRNLRKMLCLPFETGRQ